MFSQVSVCPWGGEVYTPPGQTSPGRQTPPGQTATAAYGTHPTGMHSCKAKYTNKIKVTISCNFIMSPESICLKNCLTIHQFCRSLFENLFIPSFNRNSIHMTCTNPYHKFCRTHLIVYLLKFKTYWKTIIMLKLLRASILGYFRSQSYFMPLLQRMPTNWNEHLSCSSF